MARYYKRTIYYIKEEKYNSVAGQLRVHSNKYHTEPKDADHAASHYYCISGMYTMCIS